MHRRPPRRRRFVRAAALVAAGGVIAALVPATPGGREGTAAAQTLPPECTPTLTLARASVAQSGTQANDRSFDPSVAPGGGQVAYSSFATTLAAGDTNGVLDSYVTDMATGQVERASVGAGGVQSNASSAAPVLSGDGQAVAFYSGASNMVGGDANPAVEFFGGTAAVQLLFGMLAVNPTTTVELWFKTTGSGPLIGYSNTASPTAPSQSVPILYVASDGKLRGQFWNGAVNPMTTAAAVNDGRWHHVVLTGQSTYQYLYVDGVFTDFRFAQINHLQMYYASIGRAYMTSWPGAPFSGWQTFSGKIDDVSVYWADPFDQAKVTAHYNARSTSYATTVLADTPDGYWRLAEPSSTTVAADASPNNRPGTYTGSILRQRPGALTVDGNDYDDVFVRDRTADTTTRVSISSAGVEGNRESLFPDMSPDGRYVVFNSSATNLVAGDTNSRSDLFVRDRQTNETTRVSTSSTGVQGNNGTTLGVITPDGRYVVFDSADSNLVAGDTNGRADIFVKDRQTGQTTRISTSATGAQSIDDSYAPSVSDDGRYVAFYSFASNLVAGDTNNVGDIFVKDRQTGAITRVNVGPGGVQTNTSSFSPSISGNGRYVAFSTDANNLVAGDTNAATDVFVYDRTTTQLRRASTTAAGGQANAFSTTFSDGVLSTSGLQLAYSSNATNLITGDTNNREDIYIADTGLVEGAEVERFIDLWLPRLTDQPFVDDLLGIVGYPLGILNEGFHSLSEATKHLLADCLAAEYIGGIAVPPEALEAFTDYAQEAIYRFVFDKDNLGGDERTGAPLPGAENPIAITPILEQVLGPLPLGELPNWLAPGPLNDANLLGGNLLFDGDPVAGIADTLEAFAPALPPIANLNEALQGLSGALGELDVIPLLFNLIGQLVYDVRVERFAVDGTKLGEFTENGYVVCTPRTLSSVTGSNSLPTDHDLRVSLCPDFLTFLGGADQQVAIVADALSPGVRVRVTYTVSTFLAGLVGRLQAIVDASTTGLPVETGAGSTAPFPCNQNSVPPVWPLLVGETHEGFCVQLTASSVDPSNGSNTITTYSSAPVTDLSVHLDETATGTPVPLGQVEIRNVPDADAHRITITAQPPTAANGNQIAARVAVTNAEPAVVNPDEDILIRQYDQGVLAAALTVTDVPDAFDATLTATIDGTESPRALQVAGTSDLSPATEYRLEQYAPGGTRTAHLRISSFAPSYTYRATIVRDEQLDADVGLALVGQFTPGPPAGGELYLQDTTRGAELLVRHFASDTSFTAQVDDPADPQRFNLALTNSETTPGQVIRVVQEPAGGPPIRLLLAGIGADPAEFPDPEIGRTLRWTAAPRELTLEAEVTNQPSGDPGAVRFDVTASDAPTSGVIELRDHRPAETLVLTILSPSTDQHLLITAEGPLSDPSRVRIERDNGSERPTHGLQLAVLDAAGVRAQLTFAGATADVARLVPGQGRDIDAVAANVAPQAFTYELAIDPGSGAIPAAATISGTNTPHGDGTDIVLVDNRSGLRLHQRNLPASFTYQLRTETDPTTGEVARATVEAIDQATPMPAGLLEVGFGDLAARFESFAQTFVYDFAITGPLDSPSQVVVDIDQSADNPGLLIQLAKGVTGGVADFAATIRNDATPVLSQEGRNADLLFVGAPRQVTLTLAIMETAGPTVTATVDVDLHGTDGPDTAMRLRRTVDALRQELRLAGFAPATRLDVLAEGTLAAPRRVRLASFRTQVHPTDAIQVLLYEAGALTQRVDLGSVVGGNEAAPIPGLVASRTGATIASLPEAIVLEQSVCANLGATDGTCVDGDRSVDGRERLGIQVRTYDVGATFAELTPVRTGTEIEANIASTVPGNDARRLVLADLPAEVRIRYLGPKPQPSIADNCLGDLDYTATDSLLDLELAQFMGPVYDEAGTTKLGDGCFPDTGRDATAGTLDLTITDMPSLGLAAATVHRDGSALFQSRSDASGQQVVPRVQVITPVPDWVAAFVNKERTGTNEVDTSICPEDVACIKVNYSGNPHYLNLRLKVDAFSLIDVEVRTNVGTNGAPKPVPAGSNDVQAFLWGLLPVLGVRNASPDPVVVQVFGEDDPGEVNALNVHMGCCMGSWSTSNNDITIPLDNYPDLQLAFYGWETRQILAPNGGVGKFNYDGEELPNNFGNKVQTHQPFASDTPVPFGPRFVEFRLQERETDGTFDLEGSNYFGVPGEAVAYFVPNLFDMLATQPTDINGDEEPDFDPDNLERVPWYFRSALLQTNWYWYGLLHMLEPDPMGFYP